MLRPRHPVEHIDHPFARADGISRPAHADPELQEDPQYDCPKYRRAENRSRARRQDDLARADIFRRPDKGRPYQRESCKTDWWFFDCHAATVFSVFCHTY